MTFNWDNLRDPFFVIRIKTRPLHLQLFIAMQFVFLRDSVTCISELFSDLEFRCKSRNAQLWLTLPTDTRVSSFLTFLRDFSRRPVMRSLRWYIHATYMTRKKEILPSARFFTRYLHFIPLISSFPPSAVRARSNSHVPDGTDRKRKITRVRCVIRFFHPARIK